MERPVWSPFTILVPYDEYVICSGLDDRQSRIQVFLEAVSGDSTASTRNHNSKHMRTSGCAKQ